MEKSNLLIATDGKAQLKTALQRQMEFYFSDSNLIKDKFMQNTLKTTQSIPLTTFLHFNRIIQLLSSYDSDQSKLK